MNAEQCAIVQKLISNLDNSRALYLMLKPMMDSSHACFLVSKMIDLHAAAADDLTRQVRLTGGPKVRRGEGFWARLRAYAACFVVIGNNDQETACLTRIARQEDRTTQHFQAVMAQVKGLPETLHHQLIMLESTRFQIELLVRATNETSAAPYPTSAATESPEHERSPE